MITTAVLVPQRAVQELQGTYHIVVVSPDNKAEFRPVKPGARVSSLWVIESGLKPGDKVVIAGHQKLQPGVPVQPTWARIEDEPAGPARKG
jgi:membrane fusion protein (multidrug efflux system)